MPASPSRASAAPRTPPSPPSAGSAPGGEVPKNVLKAAENGRMGPVRSWLNDGGKADTFTERPSEVSGVTIPSTLLMLAAQNGHMQIIELLLKRGAHINLQNSRGITALNAAAYCGRERVVEMLLQHGAEIGTALESSAQGGQERVVNLLLRGGAEIDQQGKDGCTALILAAAYNRPVVLQLLRAGADMTLRDAEGKTALQWSKEKGHAECVQAFRTYLGEVAAGRSKAPSAEAGGAGAAVGASATASAPSGGGGAEAEPSSGGAVPEEVVLAAERGDEMTLAWLDGGGSTRGSSASIRTAL